MISMFYLILYLLGHNELVKISKHKLTGDDFETFMDLLIKMKSDTTLENMVKDIKSIHNIENSNFEIIEL